MPQKPIQAITPRTDAEWPKDHPVRQIASRVMTDREAERLGGYLVCTVIGEPRLPPAPDDADIEGECMLCPRGIIYRRSAPKKLKRVCWRCWQGIAVA